MTAAARQSGADLLREVRAGENGDRAILEEGREPRTGGRIEPLREAQHRAVGRELAHDVGIGAARNGEDDELGRCDRSLFQRRGPDPVDPDLREMLRIPSCLRDRSRLFRIAGNECHIVPPLGEEAGEGGAPRSRPDHDRVHERLTKSMATGTPSSSKRARSRFSTQ